MTFGLTQIRNSDFCQLPPSSLWNSSCTASLPPYQFRFKPAPISIFQSFWKKTNRNRTFCFRLSITWHHWKSSRKLLLRNFVSFRKCFQKATHDRTGRWFWRFTNELDRKQSMNHPERNCSLSGTFHEGTSVNEDPHLLHFGVTHRRPLKQRLNCCPKNKDMRLIATDIIAWRRWKIRT